MATPKLRFKEFDREWSSKKVSSFLKKTSNPVNVELNKSYQQIGIRSHGKGIFHKDFVDGKALGNKRVFWVESEAFILNIVFAWERAIAVTTTAENGMIASHRFPMYLPKNNLSNVHFIRYMFLTRRGQSYLELASPGGAGRNKTLGQTAFANLTIPLPLKEEQTKIASFLSAVDDRIDQIIQKHKLLTEYKKGIMQQLFSQKLRFKADDGSDFEDWKESKFSECFTFHMTNSLSRAKLSEQGDVMNIHYGDIHTKFSTLFDTTKEEVSFIKNKTDTLKIKSDQFLQIGDLVIADASEDYNDIGKTLEIINLDGKKAVAGLHTYIARPDQIHATGFCGYMMQSAKVRKQIKVLATGISVLGISKTNLNKLDLAIPSLPEQTKIANFLTAIDQKIDNVAEQIDQAKTWKKGLLQQMFV
tara:strand:+ start:1066 stop:2316 length:1251 start_codon:yes stop_codon:yes gene_type:complete